jgi:hypothetical protein
VFSGAVSVFYGTGSGLTTVGSEFLTQDTAINGTQIKNVAETGDQFGLTLDAADVGRGRRSDLLIGVPTENNTGALAVLYGSSDGITATGNQFVTQNSVIGSVAIKDKAEPGDKFAAGGCPAC